MMQIKSFVVTAFLAMAAGWAFAENADVPEAQAVKEQIAAIGTPSEKTTKQGALDKIEMNLELAKLIDVPKGSGAEAAYREAVKLAVEYGETFVEEARTPRVESEAQRQKIAQTMEDGDRRDTLLELKPDEKLNAIMAKLEEAADKGLGDDVKLAFESLPAMSPKTEWQIHGTFYAIAQLASATAIARREAGDIAGAEKAMRAGLLFGNRLFKNGDDFVAYKYAGIRCVSEGLATAQALYMKDEKKKAVADELYAEYRKAGDKWYEKSRIVLTPNLKINYGDLWNLAENDKDKAWKHEGIMWLGVAQWMSAKAGKERNEVQGYLDSLANSTDPVIAKLAKEARAMTRDDMHLVAFNLPR